MQGEVARQKMRHQERTVFDVEEGNLAAVARLPKEYIFKYVVGAREAKTLAMTRGWGPDVCSIARSTFRCLTLAYVVLGGALACFSVSKVAMRPTLVTRFAILTIQNRTSVAGPPTSEFHRKGASLCVNPPIVGVDEPKRLPYNITNRKNGCKSIWHSQQLPVRVRRLSPKKCGPLRISSPAIEFILPFLRTARLLCV